MTNGSDAAPLSEICGEIRLSKSARKLIDDRLSPFEYLGKLLQDQHLVDAARFLAHTMPPRDMVWWTCLCLWDLHEGGTPWSDDQRGTIDAIVRWVFEPTRERWDSLGTPSVSPEHDPVRFAACAAHCCGWSSAPSAPLQPVDVAQASTNAYDCVLTIAASRGAESQHRTCARLLCLGVESLRRSPHWLGFDLAPN